MPRKPRLLVVDDSRSGRALVCELAEDAGYTIVGDVANASAGAAAAVRLDPDVVVMDWRMPELDGVGATAEILARCPTAVVVAFSSATTPRWPMHSGKPASRPM
jgi:CheY-like chemotaxis protein